MTDAERREKARLRSSFRTNVWSDLTNKNFGLKYTMHQEIRADALANLPLPGKVVSAKAGCGRSGNKTGF
jgi:hypothetical protein